MIPFLLGEGAQAPRAASRREDAAAPGAATDAEPAAEASPFARLLAAMGLPAEQPKPALPETQAAEAEADAAAAEGTPEGGDLALAVPEAEIRATGDRAAAERALGGGSGHLQTRGIPWAARLALAEAHGTPAGAAVQEGATQGKPTTPAVPAQAVAAAQLQSNAVELPAEAKAGQIPLDGAETSAPQPAALPAGPLRPSARPAEPGAAASRVASGQTIPAETPARPAEAPAAATAQPATPAAQAAEPAHPGEMHIETPRERRLAETPRERRVRDDRADAPSPEVRAAAAPAPAPERTATPHVVAPVEIALDTQAPLSGDPALELQATSGPERTGTDHAPRHAAPGTAQHAAAPRQIALAIAELGEGQTEIRLSPEELGRVRLTVASHDNAVVVQITAERPETADLLRRAAEQLSQDLSDLGYREVSIEFQFGPGADGRQPTGEAAAPEPVASPEPQVAPRAAHPLPPGPRIAAGHLDIRL